nr:hypothetical protein [Gordonia sp. (in: high G+C Gram-positive bacteria)]
MSSWQDWFGGAVTGSLGGAVTDAVDDLLVVDADEVRAIARCWEVTADEVGGMTFDPPRRVTGTSSRVIAALHVAGDLLGSVAALAAALIIILFGWTPIDPILSVHFLSCHPETH